MGIERVHTVSTEEKYEKDSCIDGPTRGDVLNFID
jgi:hypothetical protein